MKKSLLLLALFLTVGSNVACQEAEDSEEPPALRVEREVKRPPAEGEALWLQVRIGPLPAGAVLRISDGGGEELGVISPYGKRVREEGSQHLIPLPESMATEERIVILVHLRDKHGELRKPTLDELEQVRLTYVPVE